jgi:hypothetical protein
MHHTPVLRFPAPGPRPGRALGVLVRVRAARRRPMHGGVAGARPEPTMPFLVGRLGKDDRRLVVLDGQQRTPPIPGPWDLRAVFSK